MTIPLPTARNRRWACALVTVVLAICVALTLFMMWTTHRALSKRVEEYLKWPLPEGLELQAWKTTMQQAVHTVMLQPPMSAASVTDAWLDQRVRCGWDHDARQHLGLAHPQGTLSEPLLVRFATSWAPETHRGVVGAFPDLFYNEPDDWLGAGAEASDARPEATRQAKRRSSGGEDGFTSGRVIYGVSAANPGGVPLSDEENGRLNADLLLELEAIQPAPVVILQHTADSVAAGHQVAGFAVVMEADTRDVMLQVLGIARRHGQLGVYKWWEHRWAATRSSDASATGRKPIPLHNRAGSVVMQAIVPTASKLTELKGLERLYLRPEPRLLDHDPTDYINSQGQRVVIPGHGGWKSKQGQQAVSVELPPQ